MPTIGRRKGVHRYGVAHGIRLTDTMRFVIQQYANQQKITFSDALRLLLEMAISQRVNAVEAQQEQLDRIEEKVDRILGWEEPPAVDQSNYAPMSEGQIAAAIGKGQARELIERIARVARGEMLPGEINEALGLTEDRTPEQLAEDGDDRWPDGTPYEPNDIARAVYYPGTGWS